MTTYTVSIDTNGSDAALHRMVLAGLPNSYRRVDADAEVVLVSAPDPVELEQICSSNTSAIVIDRPGLLSSADLAGIVDVAGRLGCIVVPAPRYAPRLAVEGDLVAAASVEILESTITAGGSLRASLVEQLALVRTVLGAAASIRVLHASASHYAFEATMAEHPKSRVLLNAVASTTRTDEATLHALGAERRLVVRIDAGPVARPADVCCYDGEGARRPFPVHQHAHRLTLAQLHGRLTTGEGTPSYSLEDLRHDVQLADAHW